MINIDGWWWSVLVSGVLLKGHEHHCQLFAIDFAVLVDVAASHNGILELVQIRRIVILHQNEGEHKGLKTELEKKILELQVRAVQVINQPSQVYGLQFFFKEMGEWPGEEGAWMMINCILPPSLSGRSIDWARLPHRRWARFYGNHLQCMYGLTLASFIIPSQLADHLSFYGTAFSINPSGHTHVHNGPSVVNQIGARPRFFFVHASEVRRPFNSLSTITCPIICPIVTQCGYFRDRLVSLAHEAQIVMQTIGPLSVSFFISHWFQWDFNSNETRTETDREVLKVLLQPCN